jgi:sigma-B regulation protein RsbU (phosphoserine phosphatase)
MNRRPPVADDVRELPGDNVQPNGDAHRPPTASRLDRLDDLVRELSFQDDPDRLVRAFGRFGDLFHDAHGLVTVNNRDLPSPAYRISRSWRWREIINPYTQTARLPVFDRGLLGELLYGGKSRLIDHLSVDKDDPAREHLEGMRSLACAPSYSHGQPVGLSVLLHRQPAHFTEKDLETLLLNANLLGRAANVLSLAQQLEQAYRRLDREMQQAGRIQRHLLPAELPRPEGLSLAASYVTCSRAGGDYYDVRPLGDGRWGLFLADVSGHGVSAAVLMAVLHTLFHTHPAPAAPPGAVLRRANEHLVTVAPEGMFATAFYGIYNPADRTLRYSVAGHPMPRLRRGRKGVEALAPTGGLPLGILPDLPWEEAEVRLTPGDVLLLYTDGLVEGVNPSGEPFGYARIDEALRLAPPLAGPLVRHIELQYHDFTEGAADADDRTILAAVAVP